MADIYEFKCTECDYVANVSGGRDRGFEWESKTVLCRNCKELGDDSTSIASPWDDEQQSESEIQESMAFFKEAASIAPGADALFEDWDPDGEEADESVEEIDAESLFGHSLDVENCKREGHTLIDWPTGGNYECPKCAQQMLRGEVVMNID